MCNIKVKCIKRLKPPTRWLSHPNDINEFKLNQLYHITKKINYSEDYVQVFANISGRSYILLKVDEFFEYFELVQDSRKHKLKRINFF